jgi:hypothetical protein
MISALHINTYSFLEIYCSAILIQSQFFREGFKILQGCQARGQLLASIDDAEAREPSCSEHVASRETNSRALKFLWLAQHRRRF